jgi:predicted RNase H-like HicB family nuclease
MSSPSHLNGTVANIVSNTALAGSFGPRKTMETKTRDLEFNVVIERDEDGYYVASVPALRGCHTQAKSLDVLMKRVREAIELCLEVDSPVVNEFIGVQRIVVAA